MRGKRNVIPIWPIPEGINPDWKVDDCAEYFRVSSRTIWRIISRGEFPIYRVDKFVRTRRTRNTRSHYRIVKTVQLDLDEVLRIVKVQSLLRQYPAGNQTISKEEIPESIRIRRANLWAKKLRNLGEIAYHE